MTLPKRANLKSCRIIQPGIVRLNRSASVNFRNFDCLRVPVLGDSQANKRVVPEMQSSGRQEADKDV